MQMSSFIQLKAYKTEFIQKKYKLTALVYAVCCPCLIVFFVPSSLLQNKSMNKNLEKKETLF